MSDTDDNQTPPKAQVAVQAVTVEQTDPFQDWGSSDLQTHAQPTDALEFKIEREY